MRNMIYNLGYFFREVKTMLQLNPLSNIFSLISTGLIFFILAMVLSGWWISSQVVEVIQGEAEINVYFDENIDDVNVLQLMERIKDIEGVRESRIVDEDEAYDRMVEILGKEARVLEFFDENPFNSFAEIKIHLDKMELVLEKVQALEGIQHVRDNREVLDRLRDIADFLRVLGFLIITAVGITTLIILTHIIRQGIYNNREQINTLRLLGAPETFIAVPFILEGVLLTLGGGFLASGLATLTLKQVYAQMAGPLPFIPLPPSETLIPGLITIIMILSGALGIIGSFMGLSSAKSK